MRLKLLLLLLFLCAFFTPAQLAKHDKHPKHEKKDKKEKPGERHGHGPGKKRTSVEVLFDQFDDNDDSHDDDDEEKVEWLFQLQDVRGSCCPNPCLNNGVCEEKRGQFKCRCPKPFGGRRCEKAKMPCKKDTCGYGQCVLTSAPPYYECKCIVPFKPPDCRKIGLCEPNPCMNGGKCEQDGQKFECVCKEGFSGMLCQVDANDCYVGDGESYRGTASETEDRYDCMFWNSHFLLRKGINPFTSYEDTQGLGPHNFCRNPDGDRKPWCFIRSGKKLRWDHCNLKKCPETNDTIPTVPVKPKPTTERPAVIKPPVEPTHTIHHSTTKPTPTDTSPESQDAESPTPESHVTEIPPPDIDDGGTTLPETFEPEGTVPPQEFAICGKAQPKRAVNRIYGGLKAVPGAQPWQASVQSRPKGTSVGFRHMCGGILIKPCWVLTAGHCIDKTKDFRVVLGDTNLGKYEGSEQDLEVVETILHEQYRETLNSVHNDIALLRLKAKDGKCAEESQFVKVACLPTDAFPDGTECSISGWGATEDQLHGSNQLLDADVLLISQNVCSSDKVYGKVIDNGMFCAGYLEGGVDSCQGDSGGPLTCSRNQTHYAYGIVSWGDNCGEKNKPGVYTRITHYLDWINQKTASMGP